VRFDELVEGRAVVVVVFSQSETSGHGSERSGGTAAVVNP
jgi:hypothetical protein